MTKIIMFLVERLMYLITFKYAPRLLREAFRQATCLHDSNTTGSRLSEEMAFAILDDFFHGPDIHEEVFCRDYGIEQIKGMSWFRGRMVQLAMLHLDNAGWTSERKSHALQRLYLKDMERKDALEQVRNRIELYLRRYFLPVGKGRALKRMSQ